MTQPHPRVVGEAQSKMTADLLRAPPLEKQLGDHGAKVIADVDPASVVTCSTRGGTPMSIEGLISAAGPRVASQLPRDHRSRATKSLGDHAQAHPGLTQIDNLDALVLGQIARADLTDG
ncbi:hypothetical protein HNP02_008510 [Mycobacterium sp. AZCC_0083]|nr:hypothetical protein [Mycobacterium sp. AZCC_0083]